MPQPQPTPVELAAADAATVESWLPDLDAASLEVLIRRANREYWDEAAATLPDPLYDRLVEALRRLDPDAAILNDLGPTAPDAPVIEAIQTDANSLSLIVQYAPVDLEGGWSETAKTTLLERTLSALAPHMPGLAASITASEVITPDQIERETGAPGGHWHHAEMALDQILTLRPANLVGRYAFGPKGLFLCGAGTHPGGDVMGLSGRNAARTALEAAR